MNKKRKLYEAIQEQKGKYLTVATDEINECHDSTKPNASECYAKYLYMVECFNIIFGANEFSRYTRRLKKRWHKIDRLCEFLRGSKYYPSGL